MSIEEYTATYNRLRVFMGAVAARQITDEMDADKIKANRKEAKRLAKEERMRELIRQELGL